MFTLPMLAFALLGWWCFGVAFGCVGSAVTAVRDLRDPSSLVAAVGLTALFTFFGALFLWVALSGTANL